MSVWVISGQRKGTRNTSMGTKNKPSTLFCAYCAITCCISNKKWKQEESTSHQRIYYQTVSTKNMSTTSAVWQKIRVFLLLTGNSFASYYLQLRRPVMNGERILSSNWLCFEIRLCLGRDKIAAFAALHAVMVVYRLGDEHIFHYGVMLSGLLIF